jgi:ribosomal protein S27AE
MFKKYDLIIKKIKIIKNNIYSPEDKEEIKNFKRNFISFAAKYQNEHEFIAALKTYGFITMLDRMEMFLKDQNLALYKSVIIINLNEKKKCPDCARILSRKLNKLECADCHYFEFLSIVTFDKKDSKPKDYKTSNYCEKWLFNLQGKIPIKLSEEVRNSLYSRIKNMCSDGGRIIKSAIEKVTCSQIRLWLKEIGHTELNRYIPFIHKNILSEFDVAINPEQFNNREEQIIIHDWNLISKTYTEIYNSVRKKQTKKNNNSYYPVCIYFIILSRFPEKAAKVSNYIHMQSYDTVNMRKNCWELTCKKINYPNDKIFKYFS